MKEIIKREIAQRELANKHNHLRKDEITKELESLQKVVNFISSNPMLEDSGCDGCRYFNSCGIRIDYGNGGCDEKEL